MKKKQEEIKTIIRKTFQVSGMSVELCEEIGFIFCCRKKRKL